MNSEVTLPSGAILKITLSPFAISKTLYQACLAELKTLNLDYDKEIDINLMKDLFCTGFSSPAIDKALDDCLKRCTYNSVKISNDTWESVEARGDYMTALWEVALANLLPFTKNLSQQFSRIRALVPETAPKPK